MSWLVARDKAVGALLAACEGVKAKRMPLPQYQMMHPEINAFRTLTAAAVKQIKSTNGVTDPSGR